VTRLYIDVIIILVTSVTTFGITYGIIKTKVEDLARKMDKIEEHHSHLPSTFVSIKQFEQIVNDIQQKISLILSILTKK
jgi:hypothetical protein